MITSTHEVWLRFRLYNGTPVEFRNKWLKLKKIFEENSHGVEIKVGSKSKQL